MEQNITEPSKVQHEKQYSETNFWKAEVPPRPKILMKQLQPVYILFSPKFQARPTPDLGANKKGDRPEVKM